MKFSRFNVIVDDYPLKGHYLCLNTLSKAAVVLNQELLDYARSLEGKNDLSQVSEEAREMVAQLMDMHILCQDSRNEIDHLYYWLNCQRYDLSSLVLTVLTTYQCNLSCPYCYERGIDLKTKMDDKVLEDTYNWILKKIEEQRPKSINMAFLGGEPMLNTKPIDFLAENLHTLAKEKGIEYKFHLVTNGVLLTPEKVEKWMKLGMTFAQITIDGVKEIHNTMRPFAGGAGSYDIIIERMKEIYKRCPDFRLAIRINCDRDNYQRVPELLDYLNTLEFKKQLFISYGHLVPFKGADEDSTNMLFGNTEEDGKMEVFLARETKKRGFRLHDRTFNGPCMTIRRGAYLIDPLGDMYNCWSFVGRSEYKIGSIYEEKMTDFYNELIGCDLIKGCEDCPYVPICLGGCRNNGAMYRGDAKAKYCHSYFVGNNGKELLKYYFTPDDIQELARKEGYDLD